MARKNSDEVRPDIQAVLDRMPSSARVGAGREIRKLPSHLMEGEEVKALASGLYGKGNGLLTLTTHRVLFTYEGWTNSQTEDFPLNRISSVQWEAGMLLGKLIIFASGNKAEFTQMDKANGKALADAIRMNIGAAASVPTGTSTPAQTATEHPRESPSAPDPFEQLRKLGELRDAGILTPEEFEAKKEQILNRM